MVHQQDSLPSPETEDIVSDLDPSNLVWLTLLCSVSLVLNMGWEVARLTRSNVNKAARKVILVIVFSVVVKLILI